MSIRRFSIGEDGGLVQLQGRLEPVGFASSTFDWLDLEDEPPDAIREILQDIGLDSRIIDECLQKHRYSHFVHAKDSIFFELPIVAESKDEYYDYMSFVCAPRCIVTIRNHQASLLDDVLDGQVSLVSPGRAAMLYVLLEAVMEDNIETALRLRERIDDLAADADDPTTKLEAAEILPLKRRLFRYMSIFDDQMYCLGFLSQADSPAFKMKSVREHYHDLMKSMDHVLRMMNRLERRLEYVQQHCMLMLQEKTNSRMKILTVFSAVFLPLSLIAGIYGMNFHAMPELNYPFAYQVTLTIMGSIAGSMLLFFYWRGWFR